MALICGANLKSSLCKTCKHSCPKILNDLWVPKPDTHPKRCLCSRLKASNTIFVFQETRFNRRVSTTIKSRVSTAIKSRVSTAIKSLVFTAFENRVSTTIESRVSTLVKFVSPLDQCDNRVYQGFVLSHARSMSQLLQSVQQYTGKSNRQLYRFNTTLAIKSELITTARLSF